MAIIVSNRVFEGISGKLGEFIFRNVNGKTFVSKAPVKRKKSTSPKTEAVKNKFRAATIYASKIRLDRPIWELYEAKALGTMSAYNMAIADYFSVPEVLSVTTEHYHGVPGNKIYFKMNTADLLRQVTVNIVLSNGVLLESGKAYESEIAGTYVYTAQSVNVAILGSVIEIEAWDYAANIGRYMLSVN